jgi:hypothetical protein
MDDRKYGTPGLPLYDFPRPTFFPACIYCLLGVCQHDEHGKRGTRRGSTQIPAVTVFIDKPLCTDCSQYEYRRRTLSWPDIGEQETLGDV